MAYEEHEKIKASAWKRRTASLPEEARAAAPYVGKDGKLGSKPYDFCLPPEFARLSLLPEVRDLALELFRELEIPWHAGVEGGPSNHLMSSQVQCANALAQMVGDPARVMAVFGELLSIEEVLEIEPGRFLTLEYIGEDDLLNEAVGGKRTRGAYCTSVDAAFLHRASGGVIELVLVEWKYTEKYAVRPISPTKNATRLKRYGSLLSAPDSPVRTDLLSFDYLTDEPFYQLVRQQLLAHALENRNPYGAGRCRVVHVSPPANSAYQTSLARPEHQKLGSTVGEVWHRILRQPDRFLTLDSEVFLDASVTSREYAARYADRVVWDASSLLAYTGYQDIGVFEDVYDFDGDLTSVDEGLVMSMGGVECLLPYSFPMRELYELSVELERGDDLDPDLED